MGTTSLPLRALVPIRWAQTHPPDRIRPVPTADQPPALGCFARALGHTQLPVQARASELAGGSAGASAEGLLGAGAPAAARLTLPLRALAWKPGGSHGC